MTLTHHLLLFAAKLSLGLAAAMLATSPRRVTSGFFRVHSWVVLGLQVLAALSAYSLAARDPQSMRLVWICGVTAFAAYFGSVTWLYEKFRLGQFFLTAVVALSALSGALVQTLGPAAATTFARSLLVVDFGSSSLLIGAITTSMLLGHWYLNTPTMELAPLRQLLKLLACATVLRAIVATIGVAILLSRGPLSKSDWTFLALRWLAGIVAPLILTKMTWETLKIPNTQSATGILYAGVILVFVGELVAQLLGAHWQTPI